MILCCRLLCRQSPLSVLHPPDPLLVLFCEDKWNIGEPELNFASCFHCYNKRIKVWLLHSLWPIVLVGHLDTWLLDKIKKATSDFHFQLRQSSFYQIFLQGATTKAEWNKIWLFEGIRKQLRGSGFDGSWAPRDWQHNEVSQTCFITFLLKAFTILKHHWAERIIKTGWSELSVVSQSGDIKVRNWCYWSQNIGEKETWIRKLDLWHHFSPQGIFWFLIFMRQKG